MLPKRELWFAYLSVCYTYLILLIKDDDDELPTLWWPKRLNPQERGTHPGRDAAQRGVTSQQEGYKMLQQVIRDQVVSEVDSIETTTSLDDKVEHWEHKEATTAR